jgi:saccharopine dehydrogenase (NADP+, L-glutamate forming)/spermidine synthase
MVSGPLISHLKASGHELTVATRTVERAASKGVEAVRFDITKDAGLDRMVSEHDAVVSLLPYAHHVDVAKAAIKAGVHMVTTSYVSDRMRELDDAAKGAGVTLLNELGLDPGIDHIEAMSVIDPVRAAGGEVLGFESYCGGLPAPECNDNPFGYKFSWSPKGVVLAGRNGARFLKDGRMVTIPAEALFASYDMVEIKGLGTFEGYPNRDSVPYSSVYGIGSARTVLRGTLRYPGWCDTWKAFRDIGLLDDGAPEGRTYRDMVSALVPGKGALKDRVRRRVRTRDDAGAVSNMEWLGLLSGSPLLDRTSRIDALSKLLESRLVYGASERDMVILQHKFKVRVGGEERRITSTLVDYGVPGGDSAMSRTVGIPAAIGVDLLLGKDIPRGVQIPTVPEIYLPVRESLEALGIRFQRS